MKITESQSTYSFEEIFTYFLFFLSGHLMSKIQFLQHPQNTLQINANVKVIFSIIFTIEHFYRIHCYVNKARVLYVLTDNEKNNYFIDKMTRGKQNTQDLVSKDLL